MSSQPVDDFTLSDFAGFAAELQTEDRQPLELYPEQLEILRPYFEGTRYTVIILPKKNGKTTLIAALALYHLLVTPNADCIIVASSREQAGICLKQARIFVRNSPELTRILSINQRTISLEGEEGKIRILASDDDTVDGENPTLAIVDELHRHKTLDVYGVLSDGLTRPGAAMITISTAGARRDSPLGQIRDAAHKAPGFVREGKRNYLRDENSAFFEWCLDPDDDVEDLEVVKLANPAPWQTIERLKTRRTEKGMTTYRWLRFACGIWTEGEEPWIEPAVWDGLASDVEINGDRVYLGIDRGSRDEEPAIVMAARQGDRVVIRARVFPDGTDFEDLEDAVRSERARLITASYDPNQFGAVAERLTKEGFQMRAFPLTAERMSKASITLWDLIEKGNLVHDGDPQLRAHVLGGVVKTDGRGWRVQRDPRSRQPVSGLMAMMMACQQAVESPPVEGAWMAWA